VLRKRLKIIGNRIQEVRKEKGITQTELANRVGLTMNYISAVERGVTQPSLDTLFAITDDLEINISTLFLPLDRFRTKEDVLRNIKGLLETL